jgi:enterochelin esterase-like enzyme
MSVAVKATRTQVWMENLGDWSWPGTGGAAAEVLPPSWVPAFPPRREPVVSDQLAAGSWQPQRSLPWRVSVGALLSAMAALAVAVAVKGPLGLERLVGYSSASAPAAARFANPAAPVASPPPPALRTVSSDPAGSAIDTASYHSTALDGSGSFYVYLPPGFASTTRRYPVVYLLHGNNQSATAFLQVGLQGTLDRLIADHTIQPVIAVMIQGGRGPNNWRGPYERYVLEVQELVDRMLPTVAARDARAVAGDSMGGFGAMNVVLGNPYRFGVVESWLGFFDRLDGRLRADRSIIAGLGLHAFLYGAVSDHIAAPAENAPFAAALRAAGASAGSALYPGGHSLETVEAHLAGMLTYAGHTLATWTARPEATRRGAR